MAPDRQEVIVALKQGCLKSRSEYVSVRREDLLIALDGLARETLDADPPAPRAGAFIKEDKKAT